MRETAGAGVQLAVLQFEDTWVSFDEVNALAGVSCMVNAGETRIIFGAAGSGKSVLLKTAIGLLRANKGRVCLFGEDITDMSEEELFQRRSKVGVLFQESGLFDSLTVDENVAYPLQIRQKASRKHSDGGEMEEKVREALRFVELEHTLGKFPSELSGGMRRRVGIARAAVTEPPLMLYDSPTAGLDPITANTIIALAAKARETRNTTSVIVTHRYQDGHIMANYQYNPQRGRLERTPPGSDIHERTIFMVFREGQLVFEGTQEQLERETDSYISKFKSSRF